MLTLLVCDKLFTSSSKPTASIAYVAVGKSKRSEVNFVQESSGSVVFLRLEDLLKCVSNIGLNLRPCWPCTSEGLQLNVQMHEIGVSINSASADSFKINRNRLLCLILVKSCYSLGNFLGSAKVKM